MAAKANVTTTTQFTVEAREKDFVSRFSDNWHDHGHYAPDP